MAVIGIFGIESKFPGGQKDKAHLRRIQEMIGPGHVVKFSLSETGNEYFHAFAAKAKAADLDAVICTDPVLMKQLLSCLPDFRQPKNKKGSDKALTLDDYQGSFFSIDGFRIGRDKPLDVLILNPLQQLVTVPYGKFIFQRFITKITKPEKWFPQTDFTWEVANEQTIEKLYARFKTAKFVSVDIETDEDSPYRTINCIGYCGLFPDGSTHSVVIPITSMWGVRWMRLFNTIKAPKILQNGMYDVVYLLRYKAPLFNWLFDTQHLFHSWYSELPKRLDFITAFAVRKIRFWKDDGKSGGLFEHYEYNARDCWATLTAFLSMVLELPGFAKDNYIEEFPLVFPCIHCELDGLLVDKERFDKSLAEVEAKIEEHMGRLRKWIHPDFNPRSTQQVKRLLLVLGHGKKKPGSKERTIESTDEQNLQVYASEHPLSERIIGEILEARGALKLRDTYLVYEKFWNGRLHYKTNPAGTVTGRLAATESSFWTGIPIMVMPRGPEIKSFLGADDGWLLGENDQPQSEARCVGYMSGCESLINLVEGPHDYHAWNAQAFFGVPYETIYDEEKKKTLDKPLRDLSKRTNHGANYNMGALVMYFTMGPKKVAEARRLLGLVKMSLIKVCEYLLAAYERTYPEVKKDWYADIIRCIKITKKLVSPLGWTRYFFGDPGSNKQALNAAVAHGPQNLSVGIINRVFYRVWHDSIYGDLRGLVRIKAQIHDSILYAYKAGWIPQAIAERMVYPVEVTDIKGITRTMVIRPDVSAGKKFWSELK